MSAVSTTTMIGRLEGMLGTSDLTARQAQFVESLVRIRDSGNVTALTEKQVEWLNDLFNRHFAA